MQAARTAFGLVACMLVSGCSNNGTDASSGGNGAAPGCTAVNGCGGNVVGTWRLEQACVTKFVNPGSMACPQAGAQLSEDVTGTLQFKDDGTFVSNANTTIVETLTIPETCLVDAGLTETCAELQAAFNEPTEAGAPPEVASCTSAGPMGGCSCRLTDTIMGGGQGAMYSTLGARIALGGAPPATYCVQGNTLLMQTEKSNGMPGSATITVVATKQ